MIERTLAKKAKSLFSKFPIIAILGPRQSGKTTLARNLFPKLAYVSLENPDTRQFALEDPKGFLKQYEKGAIIDEVQKAPELFSYLQTLVDEKNKNGLFVLTGSQNFLLEEKISQTLAGRIALLKLLPLSLEELKNSSKKRFSLSHILYHGLYPRLFDKKIAPVDWYPNYIQTYLEKDVRLIKNVTDLHIFQKFLKSCAGRVGQVINLSSLGNDCGISYNTAKSWLSVLESSYLIFLLQPYYKNFNKRLIKMPKLYFYDTGLVCSLLGIEKEGQLETHYLKGALFESMVISEMMKNRLNQGFQPHFYFWKDNAGHEIDVISEYGDKVHPIEIKSGMTFHDDFTKNMTYWNKINNKELDSEFTVIYGGGENQKRKNLSLVSWQDIYQSLK